LTELLYETLRRAATVETKGVKAGATLFPCREGIALLHTGQQVSKKKKNKTQAQLHTEVQSSKLIVEKPWIKQPATWISIGSFIVSLSGFLFTYTLNLPALSSKVELLQPLQAATPAPFKIVVKNDGKTTARQFNANLRVLMQLADRPFEASYLEPEPQKDRSELNAGEETTLYSDRTFTLEHDHDVAAIMEGTHRLFIYGRITYTDILGLPREYHFCRFYRPAPTDLSALTLYQCSEYNETLSVWETFLKKPFFHPGSITEIAEGVRVWLASYERTILSPR
jgi:hypothetical protein